MLVTLKECAATDPNIPQNVKDFCAQVNKEVWRLDTNHFVIHVSESDDQYYALILHLENRCIYVDNFVASDIKDATVGVTFDDKSKKRICASIDNVPRDEVWRKVVQLYFWILDQIDGIDVDYINLEAVK